VVGHDGAQRGVEIGLVLGLPVAGVEDAPIEVAGRANRGAAVARRFVEQFEAKQRRVAIGITLAQQQQVLLVEIVTL
jgi:hypothetical protein